MKLFRRKKQEVKGESIKLGVIKLPKLDKIIINKDTTMAKAKAKKAAPKKAVKVEKRNSNPVKEASKARALELKRKSK